ncbi:MAG: HD domain-containing protein, partial [Omnitrophica bacterium]|nr:HD domain-containing protein [Candidatus Omnitrophota bacterium]
MKKRKNVYKKLFSVICNALGIEGLASERRMLAKLFGNIRKDVEKRGVEKRRFFRARASRFIIARAKKDYANNFMKVLGISFGGALLESTLQFKKEERIDLVLHLPSYSHPIDVKARVVRSVRASSYNGSFARFRIGVEFLEIKSADKKKLLDVLNTLIGSGNNFLSKNPGTANIGIENPAHHYALLRKKSFNRTIKILMYLLDVSDKLSYKHSQNVVKHVTKIAKALGLASHNILKIRIAALMHDLGKCKIDKAILYKNGAFTGEEWAMIKRHPTTGAVIMDASGALGEISGIVKHHHARFGGGGYPDAHKKGTNIPLGARIIAIADSYD